MTTGRGLNVYVSEERKFMNFRWLAQDVFTPASCLVFGFDSSQQLASGQVTVSYFDVGRQVKHVHNLAIVGVNGKHDLLESIVGLTYKKVSKGNLEDGTAREVYPIINDPSLPFRAGLTVHLARGTWSSLPHEFEAKEILDPKPMPFYEQFAYVTDPPGGWGIQVRMGHLFDSENSYVTWTNHTVEIRDRDILSIPLGSHPVTAGPGTRLMYFWLYWGSLEGREKFK